MSKLTEDQEDKLLEQFREEREKELRGLKLPQKADARETVQGMLRDKIPAKQSSFTQRMNKPSGVSAGHIVTENETGETFLLKHFYKSYLNVMRGPKEPLEQQDRQDAVRELLGSTMYQFLLYNRVPKEALVIPDDEDSNSLYVRSKFFTNATTLKDFFRLSTLRYIDSGETPQALEGFEKAIAACDLLREVDYHTDNLMVQDESTVTKIDHGRSFLAKYTDFGSMVKEKHTTFNQFGHTEAIKAGKLSFNIEKYSQALNQMLEQYNEQQMEAVIDQKFDELAKAGFHPIYTVVFPIDKSEGEYIDSFDALKKFYKDYMRSSATIMQDIAKSAEVISKFSNVPYDFSNGGWLEAFATSPIQDPVAYAAQHNIQIEEQNALEWAYNNNYKIKYSSAITSKTITEKQWKKDNSGKWHEEEVEVTRDYKTKQEIGPIEYIAMLKLTKQEPLSKSEEEFLTKAIADNLTNASGKNIESILSDSGLQQIQPAAAPIHSQGQNIANILAKVINNFIQETTGAKVTTEKATELYDILLSAMEERKYLTKQDIANIKQHPNYTKQVEDTAKLMNTETFQLGPEDVNKLYSQVASFIQTIKPSNISKYFPAKMTAEEVSKINAIEAALSRSIKVNTVPNESKPILQTKRLERAHTQVKEQRGR